MSAERLLEQALREVLRISREPRRKGLAKSEHHEWQLSQIRALCKDALEQAENERNNEPLPPLHPEHVTGAVKGRHIA